MSWTVATSFAVAFGWLYLRTSLRGHDVRRRGRALCLAAAVKDAVGWVAAAAFALTLRCRREGVAVAATENRQRWRRDRLTVAGGLRRWGWIGDILLARHTAAALNVEHRGLPTVCRGSATGASPTPHEVQSSLLLMKDRGGSEDGDKINKITTLYAFGQAQIAVAKNVSATHVVTLYQRVCRKIAKLHARHWGDESLWQRKELYPSNADTFAVRNAALLLDWKHTKRMAREVAAVSWRSRGGGDNGGNGTGGKHSAAFETYLETLVFCQYLRAAHRRGADDWTTVPFGVYKEMLRDEGFSLTHGDLVADNVLLVCRNDNDDDDVMILDWEDGIIGDPVRDLAVLLNVGDWGRKLGGGSDPFELRLHETSIVRAWWQAFQAERAQNEKGDLIYPFEYAWLRYSYFAVQVQVERLMAAHALGYFEADDDGRTFRGLVESVHRTVSRLGDPLMNFDNAARVIHKARCEGYFLSGTQAGWVTID